MSLADSADTVADTVADAAPAVARHGHEGLHGIVALDHPFALIGLVVVSGVVLFAVNWHAKRKAKKTGRA